jgi:hypothetical protein
MISRLTCAFLTRIHSYIRLLVRPLIASDPTAEASAPDPRTQPRHPEFPQILWTYADDFAAQAEGWTLAQTDNTLQINSIKQACDPQLADDLEALAYVATRAAGESERHERAFRIHADFATNPSEPLLTVLRMFLVPVAPLPPTSFLQRAQRTVERSHWLADRITAFLLIHQEALEVPAIYQDPLEPTPYANLLNILENLATFHKNKTGCVTQFIDWASPSPYCDALLATLRESFQYLLRSDTIAACASATWCYLTLALITALREITRQCGRYAITSWPRALQFEPLLENALQVAYTASESSGHPAQISHDGEFIASVTTRQPS